MKSIIIVSPDPETSRMLELSFELNGWEVKQATTTKAAEGKAADIALIDMVEGLKEFEDRETLKRFAGARIVAIAPRGMRENDLVQKAPHISRFIKRPYDLTHIIKIATKLLSSK